MHTKKNEIEYNKMIGWLSLENSFVGKLYFSSFYILQ